MDEARESMESGVLKLLHTWMPAQRWYPAKGRGVGLHLVRALDLGPAGGGPDPGEGVLVESWVVALDSGDRLDLVQVPLVFRTEPRAGGEPALLGLVAHPEAGMVSVYDGPHDPAYVDAALAALRVPTGAAAAVRGRPSKVLTGEQSNTSVIIGEDEPDPYILKVFRPVNHGRNPDVEVVAALSGAGCERVPRLIGWSGAHWSSNGVDGEGDTAVAMEFLTGSQDAWREALVSAHEGADFTAQAHALGEATGQVHAQLAQIFGLTEPEETTARRIVEGLQRRVDWALESSGGALSQHKEALAAHRDSLTSLIDDGLPALQRVHGDYHLGQVLHSPARGWVLLDFEGEPLRPLAERSEPDLALRDVIGMLRSFDYAAGHVSMNSPETADRARQWSRAARDAFLQGYATTGSPVDTQGGLYRALWLDKALYEVVYEVGNRPDWTPIPLAAVAEVL